MSASRLQTRAAARFTCLGDQCPDTCCKGWGMQLTPETLAVYNARAPELLAAVDSSEAGLIMKRDPVTDYCVRYAEGWCGIHRDYGAEFLGDACHFYPRITRALESTVLTGLALSCPEAARLMLFEADALAVTPREALRLPFSLRNYLPPGLDAEAAQAMHQRFVEEGGNPAYAPAHNLMRCYAVVRALALQPVDQWPEATAFYFKIASGRLPPPEADANDLIHLAQALMGLAQAGNGKPRPGLTQLANAMQQALGMAIDPQSRQLSLMPDARERGVKLLHCWQQVEAALQPVLARYLQAQLSQALFPFAGLGDDAAERLVIIGVRYATLRLAFMTAALHGGGAVPDAAELLRITYTLSRFLDHLADPALSLAIYRETGWVREARLRALVGDR